MYWYGYPQKSLQVNIQGAPKLILEKKGLKTAFQYQMMVEFRTKNDSDHDKWMWGS